MEEFIEKIKSIIDKHVYVDKKDSYSYGIEIYVDYRDELSDETVKEIVEHNNPYEAFQDKLGEWAFDYEIEYGLDEIEKEIKNQLSDEEINYWDENEDEINEWINEHIYFYYPEEHFNKYVKVNIILDTGDMNYDFTKNNVLGYYGRMEKGAFEKESSILWLAKTQKKAQLLRKRCKAQFKGDGNYVGREKEQDTFIESIIQELENVTTHMNALTFLVSMPLLDFFKLKDKIKSEKGLNNSYKLEERKGTGYIILDKSTVCGLYDQWNGAGSCFEIELDKDVKIPYKCIFKAEIDGTYKYGIDDIYGMCADQWKETLKEMV